jgi:hypothetical protein
MSNSPKLPPSRRPRGSGPSRHPVSFTKALRRAAVRSLVTSGGVVAGFAVTLLAVDAGPLSTTYDDTSREAWEPENKVQDLIDAHDCWSDGATMPQDMQGRYPGHVIVTVPERDGPTYSARLVGAALAQVFGTHQSSGMTVHAFCR